MYSCIILPKNLFRLCKSDSNTRLQGVGFPKPTPLISENQRQETNSPSENKETGDRRSHYFYRENQPLSAENQPQAAAPRRPSAAPTPAVPGVLELNKGVAHPSRSDCRFWLAGCHAVLSSTVAKAESDLQRRRMSAALLVALNTGDECSFANVHE